MRQTVIESTNALVHEINMGTPFQYEGRIRYALNVNNIEHYVIYKLLLGGPDFGEIQGSALAARIWHLPYSPRISSGERGPAFNRNPPLLHSDWRAEAFRRSQFIEDLFQVRDLLLPPPGGTKDQLFEESHDLFGIPDPVQAVERVP